MNTTLKTLHVTTKVAVKDSVDFGASHFSGRLAHFGRSTLAMIRSEARVLIFVWAIATSYLVASDLRPQPYTLMLLISSGYLVSLGVYVLNALTDSEEDKINSPHRPIPSGKVSRGEAKALIIILLSMSLFLVSFVNVPTLALYIICIFIGAAYSLPSAQVKSRYQLKMTVPIAGAGVFSLAGGTGAQSLNATIFFVAVAFALFGLVTLLLGDLADVKGDSAAGVKSLPVVIGPKNSARLVTTLPLVLSMLGIATFRFMNLNVLFLILFVAISAYSSLSISTLLSRYSENTVCRKVKSRMRIVSFLLQLTFVVGLLAL